MSTNYKNCSKCGETRMQPPRYDEKDDALVRICPNCGYRTTEAPKDAPRSLIERLR